MRISTHSVFDRGIKPITRHQSALARVQEEISSGQKILKPSDNPTDSARLLELHKQIELNDQYNQNIIIASGRQGVEENAIQASNEILQRARELTIQANNAALSDENRQSIALEIRQLRSQLLDIANTRDGDGAYLFAGFKEQTQPFTLDGDAVIYNGDQGQRLLQVGPSRKVAVGDPGDAVFMNIRSGDEQFQVTTGIRNTGSGTISVGTVTDPIAFQNDFMGHEYRIEFTSATEFDVVEITEGVESANQVLTNQIYLPGQPISFRGAQVVISGAPAAGDEFNVQTAPNNDLFAVLQNLTEALESPTGTPVENALLTRSLANTLDDLDQGLQQLSQIQGHIGSRMNALEAQEEVNETFNLELKELQMDLGAVDYADAATRLSEELLALQAAQQSFMKIQGLSLFNYLS